MRETNRRAYGRDSESEESQVFSGPGCNLWVVNHARGFKLQGLSQSLRAVGDCYNHGLYMSRKAICVIH